MTNFNSEAAVPQAREALNQFKNELANEIGVPLKQRLQWRPDFFSSRICWGYMGKKMIAAQERAMASGSGSPR